MNTSIDEMVPDRELWDPDKRRAWRELAGLTLEQMADHLGVTKMTVWRWETGQRTPRGENRVKYSRLLRDLKKAIAHD